MSTSYFNIFFTPPERVLAGISAAPKAGIERAVHTIGFFSSWLFHRSILTYSNERIAAERLEREHLPLSQKIWQSAKRSAFEFPKTLTTLAIIRLALNLLEAQSSNFALPRNDRTSSLYDMSLLQFVLFDPILEECVFRGALLPGFSLLQNYIQNHTPRSLQGKTVEWLTSAYARILLTQILFASIHLQASYQSTYRAVAQSLGILLAGSSCSIEFETTNSLLSSSVFHITNNALARGVLALANQ